MPKQPVAKPTSSPANASLQADILMSHYRLLAEDIRHLESATERVFGVGIALVSALVAFAYKERIDEVYFIAAPAYLGLLLYAANQWNSVFWKGGYKRHLEDCINQFTELAVVGWEQFAEDSRGRLSTSYAMFGAFVLISLFSIFGISVVRINSSFGSLPAVVFAAVCVVLFLCLVFSIWRASGMFESSYALAKSIDSKEKSSTT